MAVVKFDFRFRTPFGLLCFGPTGSGKTWFIRELLRNRRLCFDNPPERVVYVYSQWQNAYDDMLADDPKIQFTQDLMDVIGNGSYFDKKMVNLLILDDMASAVADSKDASNLFTRGVHHKNISVIHICQNMYQQGKAMRNLHLNSHYFILFKNVRDHNQIKLLGRQTNMPYLSEAYEKTTAEPYQPLILDLKGDCPKEFRIRSHVLPGQILQVHMSSKHVPQSCRRK
jgi:hypothetical protein